MIKWIARSFLRWLSNRFWALSETTENQRRGESENGNGDSCGCFAGGIDVLGSEIHFDQRAALLHGRKGISVPDERRTAGIDRKGHARNVFPAK